MRRQKHNWKPRVEEMSDKKDLMKTGRHMYAPEDDPGRDGAATLYSTIYIQLIITIKLYEL